MNSVCQTGSGKLITLDNYRDTVAVPYRTLLKLPVRNGESVMYYTSTSAHSVKAFVANAPPRDLAGKCVYGNVVIRI